MAPGAEGQPRVQWQSVRWPDNSTFEGLVKEDKCHVRGVFKYANGDRYEGEFEENNMSGYGVYVWGAEGSVYRGQWKESMMDGCGVKITKQPNGAFLAEEGQFVRDEWVGDVLACTVEQARQAAAAADAAAQMARVFELGGGSSDAAAAVARAQAAAEAAAAQPAKARRHQRQQQQQQRAAADAAPSTAATPATAVAPPPPVSASTLPARQRQQAPMGFVQEAVHNAAQAAQAAQRAAQAALQRLTGSGGRRQEPPVAA